MELVFLKRDLDTAALYLENPAHGVRISREHNFSDVDGRAFEAFEGRANTDGTPWPQYGLSCAYQMLVATPEKAGALREKLSINCPELAECTIESQYGEYVGFRCYSRYVPGAGMNVYRLPNRRTGELTPPQFYSHEFVHWLYDTFDTRGLISRAIDSDGEFSPKWKLEKMRLFRRDPAPKQ